MAYTIREEKGAVTIIADGAKEKDAFVDAARGLFSSLYDFENIRGRDERVKIVVEGKSIEDLLGAWLSELLERQAIHEIVFGSVSISSLQKIRADQFLLTGSALGEAYDSAKHDARSAQRIKTKSISCKSLGKKYSCEFQIEK